MSTTTDRAWRAQERQFQAMNPTDSEGYPLRPMGQTQWDRYADRLANTCTCGCNQHPDACTTPIPEGPARDLTDAEEEREALGEWYMEYLWSQEPMSPEDEEQAGWQ